MNDTVGPAPLSERTVLDVLAFPEGDHPSWEPLCTRLATGSSDEAELICLGIARHLGRRLRCAWHLVLHRSSCGEHWTHLYRVLPDHGGHALVLLDRAQAGDAREPLRDHALRMADLCTGPSGRGAGLRG